jgi:peroxiredoxin Q/BCP
MVLGRTGSATAAALLVGLFNVLTGRGERHPVVLAAGDMAPDFELRGSDGRPYALRDYRGREAVVLAWFPKAFTSGCTAECRSIAASRDARGRFQAQYFVASVDSEETSRRFAESVGADYPVLSDPPGAVARAYGVLGASGFPRRWTFYIGVDGRILAIDKQVRTASHGADVLEQLNRLNVPRRT